MQKVLVIFSSVILATGCASKKYNLYEHPEYGLDDKDNPHYQTAENECKDSVYSKGVIVNGELTTDIEKINKHNQEYSSWIIDQAMKAVYSSGTGGAHAGTMGATSVSTGKIVGQNPEIDTNRNYDPSLPKKYQDIERSRGEWRECIEAKGWKKII